MNRRRKILLYTHALTGGGAERAWALLASGLARRGHDVVFATDFASGDNAAFLEPAVRVALLGPGHIGAVGKLARLIEREAPDVALSALCVSNLKLFGAASIAGFRRRAILSYHGFHASEPQFLSRLSYALTPLLTRATGRTIVVSDALKANLIDVWRAAPGRTRRIYNPVAWGDAPSRATEESIRSRPPMVLAIGRLVGVKNFDGLIRAVSQLSQSSARLVILGEGPERDRLAAEAARLGVDHRVDMPGYVAEPWDYYARASCLVVNSRSETFGMTVVEALAHGLPVVSTDCGGPAEILAGGAFGRLIPIGDEQALALAIDLALASPGSPEARMRRAADFSTEVAIDAYENLIDEVLREANPRTVDPDPVAAG